jgi:CheY-like chemotaxis protein
VAHDFNNLLTAVIGNLELISGARGDADKIERLAQHAMKAAQRGEHLVRQLLTYARRQISRPRTVDLNRLIADSEDLIRRLIGEEIEVVTMLSPVPAWVQIDPAQFETALLNLVINARDALADGGRITIETRHVIVDQQPSADDPEMRPGPHVMVVVGDSGAGMTPAVLARAFDPFFTTKEVGKGSGLGLSQVYGFTKTAAGQVKIHSALGSGTTVELYLPKSADRSVPPAPEAGPASLPPAAGRETILVVEDEEEVLAVTTESLRELGYQVVTRRQRGAGVGAAARRPADRPLVLGRHHPRRHRWRTAGGRGAAPSAGAQGAADLGLHRGRAQTRAARRSDRGRQTLSA